MSKRLTLLVLLAMPLFGCEPYRTVDFYDEKTGETQHCAVDANHQPVQCRGGLLNRGALADQSTFYRDVLRSKSQ